MVQITGKIPHSKEFLKLERLWLNRCDSLKEIPLSIGYWKSLEELDLQYKRTGPLPDSV